MAAVLILLLVFVAFVAGGNDKRLLLNDPDVLSSRLAHLEQLQQTLTNTINQLNSKYTQLQTKTSTLETYIQKQDAVIAAHQDRGSTYVRWGRKKCEGVGTENVYSGYAAGQNYYYPDYSTRYGGPANTLCLPDNPQLSNTSFTKTDIFIMGSEYEGNTFAHNSQDEDVPCALCRSINTTSVVMIPGRHMCYPGWRLEYAGLLAAGHYTHTASSYVCIDKSPEYIPSGKANQNGHLLYMVGIKCGPLPCPPYEDNRNVPCVVCSK